MAINMCCSLGKNGVNVNYCNVDGYDYISEIEEYYKNQIPIIKSYDEITNLIDVPFSKLLINTGHTTVNGAIVHIVDKCDELILYVISPLLSIAEIDLVFNIFPEKKVNLACLNCENEKVQEFVKSKYISKSKSISFQKFPLDIVTSNDNENFYKDYLKENIKRL